MAKATAVANPNIAFIKYWGKVDETLTLPANPSLSMNLAALTTVTTVQFRQGLPDDVVAIDEQPAAGQGLARVVAHLDRVRAMADYREGIKKEVAEVKFLIHDLRVRDAEVLLEWSQEGIPNWPSFGSAPREEEKSGGLGFELESRTFRPHVTLARKVSDASGYGPLLPVTWMASELALVESRTGDAPHYHPLARWPLA